MPRIIGVMSGKGGVGKTTVVTNLSTVLSKLKKSVTVVDCNVTTAHLSMHFGVYFNPMTLNDVLKNEASIESVMLTHFSGVKIVPASMNLSDLVGVDISTLDSKLRNFFQDDDFVFLDIAPGFGKEAISAMKASEEALIVTTPTMPAVADVVRMKSVLEDLGIDMIGIVLNKVTGKKFELNDKEIVQLTRLPILVKIPFDHKIQESLAAKIPLVMYDKGCKASIEFQRLAFLLLGEVFKPTKIGFLERIRRIFHRLS